MTKTKKNVHVAKTKAAASPSLLIDAKIKRLGDWRGKSLPACALIKEADPEIVEDVKWKKPSNPAGVSIWEHGESSAPARRSRTMGS